MLDDELAAKRFSQTSGDCFSKERQERTQGRVVELSPDVSDLIVALVDLRLAEKRGVRAKLRVNSLLRKRA